MKQPDKFDINIDQLKSFDVQEYLIKVISNWKLFLVTLIIGLLIASFINRYKQKNYSLNSIITVKEEQNPLFSSNTNIAFNWGGPSDKVETVITILKSRSHNEIVVDSLKYYIDYLKEGRFRMLDIYGNQPFVLELDSLSYNMLNTPIKLAFLDNELVELSAVFEDDNLSLMNFHSKKSKKFVPEIKTFNEQFNIHDTIETPFCRFKINKKNFLKSLAGQIYFIRFKSFNGTVRKYQNISVKTLTKGTSIIQLELTGPNKHKIEEYINTTVGVLDSIQSEQ